MTCSPLISCDNVTVNFPMAKKWLLTSIYLTAIKGISLKINANDVFCLIGESGSGKSTIAKTLLGFHPYEGRVFLEDAALSRNDRERHLALRRQAQMVFQDPWASLSPYHTLQWSIEEPLRASGVPAGQRKKITGPLVRRLNLDDGVLGRLPAHVSGGECQRACIARALVKHPRILFLDEPLNALDAHIKKQVADLLLDLKQEFDLTYFLISHDLALVKKMATTVMVLYLGRVMETARASVFFEHRKHPYSYALLSSVLTPGFWNHPRVVLKNEIPSPMSVPKGCVFHTRCLEKTTRCQTQTPALRKIGPDHFVACHLV